MNNNAMGGVILVGSRAQAIRDRTLFDVTDAAREAGIEYPVALTREAWIACINLPAGVFRAEEDLRLQELLWMYRAAAVSAAGRLLTFGVHVRRSPCDSAAPQPRVLLKALCGPGDQQQPVITIMMPWETYLPPQGARPVGWRVSGAIPLGLSSFDSPYQVRRSGS